VEGEGGRGGGRGSSFGHASIQVESGIETPLGERNLLDLAANQQFHTPLDGGETTLHFKATHVAVGWGGGRPIDRAA